MENPIIPGLNIPVRTIYCVGRNFIDHAAEMKSPIPAEPIIFLKPLSSICFNHDVVNIPSASLNVHYEGEIVITIGKKGKNILEHEATNYIGGIGCGIDFTARDIQQKAKKQGLPWSISKGFENFAPISNFEPFDHSKLAEYQIMLSVNKEVKQKGELKDLIFTIPYLVCYLSKINTLYPGDLIFTGTPKGVGQVKEDDKITASIPQLNCSVSVSITS